MKLVPSIVAIALLSSLALADSPPMFHVMPHVMPKVTPPIHPQVAPPVRSHVMPQPTTQFVPQVSPQVAPQNPYYFGMSVQAIHTYQGAALQIAGVTPGGPACQAGLEVGDVINVVNGQRIMPTNDSYQAVRQLNAMVRTTSTTGPAPAVAAYTNPQTAYYPPQRPYAAMSVTNVRTGRPVQVTVYPTAKYAQPAPAPVPAPAPAAAYR